MTEEEQDLPEEPIDFAHRKAMMTLAIKAKELHSAFIAAGFSEAQAMAVVVALVSK